MIDFVLNIIDFVKAEAAKLREDMEAARKKAAAAQVERSALSILSRSKHSDALARRNAAVRARTTEAESSNEWWAPLEPPHEEEVVGYRSAEQRRTDHKHNERVRPSTAPASRSLRGAAAANGGDLNDPTSSAYAAELRQLEASITGGTLGSLQAAGGISEERMAAELSARAIVQDAALIAEREIAMEMAYDQAQADERFELEATDAPRWSELSAAQCGGAEVPLAADSLYALGDDDLAAEPEADLGLSGVTAGSLDDMLAKMQAEIALLEEDFGVNERGGAGEEVQ